MPVDIRVCCSSGQINADCSNVNKERFVEYEIVLKKEYLNFSICLFKISVLQTFQNFYLLKPLL